MHFTYKIKDNVLKCQVQCTDCIKYKFNSIKPTWKIVLLLKLLLNIKTTFAKWFTYVIYTKMM